MNIFFMIMMTTTSQGSQQSGQFTNEPNEVRIMTLDPGHFHAALIQKYMLSQVDPTVYIYGPEGSDLDMHLKRIEGFNNREENPTEWVYNVYKGLDFLDQMLEEQPGNVMVTAGNNRLKTEYIKQAVDHGINVLSDKPMAIDKEGWELLVEAFKSADENSVLLYDIMTERKEVTTTIQRRLAQNGDLFGKLEAGTAEKPAIIQQNTHHLLKTVSGETLRRPPWYFDIKQQGEGIVDITTHLIDLALWGAFPEEGFDYRKEVEMLEANRRATVLSSRQFEKITGMPEFPNFLKDQLIEGNLPYYCNGDMHLTIRGHHTKISVQWNYQPPAGGGDTHFSMLRGTRSDLVIRQGAQQDFKSTLYIKPANETKQSAFKPIVREAVAVLQHDYAGLDFEEVEDGWKLVIPDEYYLGHEAHFSKVAEDYFGYLVDGKLPEWEVLNMITKYYITTQARELAMKNN